MSDLATTDIPLPPFPAGSVALVGAGPGDASLLTLKAADRLRQADLVLYDEYCNRALLALAPAAASRIYVGKRAGCHAMPQAEIIGLMREHARQGKRIVRLKGGDPFVFGRGGEEALALAAAGIAWELVPGVSAGYAAPGLADIPVTLRGTASSVAFMSGHGAGGEPEALPRADTLVVFMGLARLEALCRRLVAGGWSPDTPAAVVASASLPEQRVVSAPLEHLAAATRRAEMESPALVVVGQAVGARQRLRRPEGAEAAAKPADAAQKTGLVLIAHGSPLTEWHASVERLLSELRPAFGFCEAAYLEPARPRLEEVVEQAAATGLGKLTVVPYFLAAGLHVTRDIPALVEAARQRFPELKIALSDCLEGHPGLRTAVLSRARNGGGAPR